MAMQLCVVTQLQRFESDGILYTALLSACEKGIRPGMAMQVCAVTQQQRFESDVIL